MAAVAVVVEAYVMFEPQSGSSAIYFRMSRMANDRVEGPNNCRNDICVLR